MQRAMVRWSVVAFVVAAATACSSGPPTNDPAPPPAAGTATPAPGGATPSGRTDLTITYRSAPAAQAQTWTLTCHPTGGTVDDPAQACAALAENGKAMAPTPADAMCTQVFGGEDVATVSGTWGAIDYDGRFSRKDGCEVSRWDALVGLLPVGGTR